MLTLACTVQATNWLQLSPLLIAGSSSSVECDLAEEVSASTQPATDSGIKRVLAYRDGNSILFASTQPATDSGIKTISFDLSRLPTIQLQLSPLLIAGSRAHKQPTKPPEDWLQLSPLLIAGSSWFHRALSLLKRPLQLSPLLIAGSS